MSSRKKYKNKEPSERRLKWISRALILAGFDPHILRNKTICGVYCASSALVSGASFANSIAKLERLDEYEDEEFNRELFRLLYDFCLVPIRDATLFGLSLRAYKNL